MGHWNARQRSVADVLWPSFLAAVLASTLFFTLLDPQLLRYAAGTSYPLGELTVYSIGFLFFWVIAAFSSALTTWLIRTERRVADFPTQSDDKP